MGRYDILHKIQQLDPERDNMQIMFLSFGYEFSWDSIRALEIALFRTYCSPRISALLDRTGEFRERTQRRYDDTSLLMAEICKWGYIAGRGKEALEQMNWAHSHYPIANEDYLYVLSTFIYEPIAWIDSFGWRPTCEQEKRGYYCFWREVGRQMGIRDIPPTFEAFEQWKREYERWYFRYAESNHRVGTLTCELFVSWYPQIVAPLVRASIHALLDDTMLGAFGFPQPRPLMRRFIRGMLKLRARIVRFLPPRTQPHFFMDNPNRTYPTGYTIQQLGPPRLVARERREPSAASS